MDRQDKELLAMIVRMFPYGKLPTKRRQHLIEHPDELKSSLFESLFGLGDVLHIDRTKPFDLVDFFGEGWSINEQDERSIAITELDINKIRLKTMLRDGETSISYEEKLARLKKAGHIRLDAKVFQTLWENQKLIPERWEEGTNGDTTCILFDGTELRDPDGDSFFICLYRVGGQWRWGCERLSDCQYDYDPSAVLVSD